MERFPVKRFVVGLVISVAILWLVFSQVDLARVWDSIKSINPYYYGLALFAFFLTYPLRTFRWRTLLSAQGYKARFAPLFKIICFTWFFNSVSPSKFGEAYRIWSARKLDMSRSKITALMILERFFDLAVIIILSFAFVYLSGISDPLINNVLKASLGFILLVGAFLGVMLKKPGFAKKVINTVFSIPVLSRFEDKFEKFWKKFSAGFKIFTHGKKLVKITVLTVLVWLLEIVTLQFVASSFGVALDFYFLGFLAILTALITALPLTPGGLGVAEFFLVALFAYQGVSRNVGASMSLLFRFATLYVTIILGALAMPFTNPLDLEK